MYAHCLFCNADLGRNEALEAFPVGRRLAYDAAKGRLWVVCLRCARWNLTPLEARWEAVEQAERLCRGTRLRASTDHVGLARVADGVDLVRIGRPLLPEFAAWRYGRQLRARRLRYAVRATPSLVVGGVGAVGMLGAYLYVPTLTAAAGFVGMFAGFAAVNAAGDIVDRIHRATHRVTLGTPATVAGRVCASADAASRRRLVIRRGHLAESTLRTDAGGELVFDLRHDAGRVELRGSAARQAGALLSPTLNPDGSSAVVLDAVVRSIAVRGGPEGYLALAGRWIGTATRPMAQPPRRWEDDARVPDAGLYALTSAQRLALELVLHDDAERRAMDGELADLERAWRDAEEIAGIADSLALPTAVESAWDRLRAGVRP